MARTFISCSHISFCFCCLSLQRCQARGHICEWCNGKDYLFPFQVDDTTQCSKCQSYFHSECYAKMIQAKQTCPKCARIAAHETKKKKRQAEEHARQQEESEAADAAAAAAVAVVGGGDQ
jgi:hypothetical protein